MTASVRRRTSFSRALLALAGVALLALLALGGAPARQRAHRARPDGRRRRARRRRHRGRRARVTSCPSASRRSTSSPRRALAASRSRCWRRSVVVGAGAFRRLRVRAHRPSAHAPHHRAPTRSRSSNPSHRVNRRLRPPSPLDGRRAAGALPRSSHAIPECFRRRSRRTHGDGAGGHDGRNDLRPTFPIRSCTDRRDPRRALARHDRRA